MTSNSENYDAIVVDDTEENLDAAREALGDYDDIDVDYASCCKEAEQMLEEGNYDLGIFDLHMPYTQGGEPEKLGTELAQIAADQEVPWAILTSGIDHHNSEAAFVTYFWDPSASDEMTDTPKTDPESWEETYEDLKQSLIFPERYDYKALVGSLYSSDEAREEDIENIKGASNRLREHDVDVEAFPEPPMEEFRDFDGEPQLETFNDS